VVLGKITQDDYLVLACDEIDDIRLSVDDFTFEMSSGGFVLSGSTTYLAAILNAIIDQLLAVYALKDVAGINAIKTLITSLFGGSDGD
jgi:hypothetical protein